MDRELELLPEVAERVECRVPSVLATGEMEGRPFMLYQRIPGRPMRPGDDLDALGRFLAGLWSTPPRPGMPFASAERTEFLAAVEREVLPVLPAELRPAVERDLVPDAPSDDAVVIHHDLGPDHVLFDDSGRLSGVIDFTDAAIGNPNGDLVGVLIAAGEEAVEVVARAAGIEPDWERLRRYWRFGPLHEVVHGLRSGQPAFVASGIEGARLRFGRQS